MFINIQFSRSVMSRITEIKKHVFLYFYGRIHEFVPVKRSLPHTNVDELWKLEIIGNTTPYEKEGNHGVI